MITVPVVILAEEGLPGPDTDGGEDGREDGHRRDGRTWSVRRNIQWSPPATGDDFEHDVDGGRGAALLILSSLFVFW